jgi:hypothetical protein
LKYCNQEIKMIFREIVYTFYRRSSEKDAREELEVNRFLVYTYSIFQKTKLSIDIEGLPSISLFMSFSYPAFASSRFHFVLAHELAMCCFGFSGSLSRWRAKHEELKRAISREDNERKKQTDLISSDVEKDGSIGSHATFQDPSSLFSPSLTYPSIPPQAPRRR